MSIITQSFVRGLSIGQREILIAHVGGPQPASVYRGRDNQTIANLMALDLLRGERSFRPTRTMLTEAGREAAAVILGQYADALVAAGCLEPDYFPEDRPLDILRRLKARRRPEPATPAVLAAQLAETRAKPGN